MSCLCVCREKESVYMELRSDDLKSVTLTKKAKQAMEKEVVEVLSRAGIAQKQLAGICRRLPKEIFVDIEEIVHPDTAVDLLCRLLKVEPEASNVIVEGVKAIMAHDSLTREVSPDPRPTRVAAQMSRDFVRTVVEAEKNDGLVGETLAPPGAKTTKGAAKAAKGTKALPFVVPDEDNTDDDEEDEKSTLSGESTRSKREDDAARATRKARESSQQLQEGFRHPSVLFDVAKWPAALRYQSPDDLRRELWSQMHVAEAALSRPNEFTTELAKTLVDILVLYAEANDEEMAAKTVELLWRCSLFFRGVPGNQIPNLVATKRSHKLPKEFRDAEKKIATITAAVRRQNPTRRQPQPTHQGGRREQRQQRVPPEEWNKMSKQDRDAIIAARK